MKNFWLIFILGLGCPVFGQTEDLRFTYGIFKALIRASSDSKFYSHEISTLINLSNSQTNVELIFLDRNNTTNVFFIELSPPQRQDFLQAIGKYKDWYKKAINLEYKIEKIITNVYSTSIFWRKEDDNRGFFSYNDSFIPSFFSQNKERHQLILIFPSIQNSTRTISIKIPSIYLDYDEVLKLERLFSDKAIRKAIKRKTKR